MSTKVEKVVGTVVVVLALVGATGAGCWSVYDGVTPRSLSVVDAQLHARLGDQVDTVAAAITAAWAEVARVTGVDANLVTTGSEAAMAHANTWVNPKAPEVEGLVTQFDRCDALVVSAVPMLDGTVLFSSGVYGGLGDAGESVSVAHGLSTELDECVPFIQGRVPVLDKILTVMKDRAAMAIAGPDNDAARATLKTAMDEAAKVLSDSKGKVADDAVRTVLESLGKKAAALLAESMNGSYLVVEDDTAAVEKLIVELRDATEKVSDAQTAWQKNEDEAKAQAEAEANGGVYYPPTSGGGGTYYPPTSGGGGTSGGGSGPVGGGGTSTPPPAVDVCDQSRPGWSGPSVSGKQSGGNPPLLGWGISGGSRPLGCNSYYMTLSYHGTTWNADTQWNLQVPYGVGGILTGCIVASNGLGKACTSVSV
ncbi:MAG: hypothetical protein LBN10_00095 [Propionibacteriaceae bacterium]|jgi:hypothetical protein|nr:hypothetical protein [Propionibacteriaceae bacterium]